MGPRPSGSWALHETEIRLLPALPPQWTEGSVRGLRARGGYSVDISWRDGKLVNAVVRATQSGKVTVRCGEQTWALDLKAGDEWVQRW